MNARSLSMIFGAAAMAALTCNPVDAQVAAVGSGCLATDVDRTPIGTEEEPGLRVDLHLENQCSFSGVEIDELMVELLVGDEVRDSDDASDGRADLSVELFGDDAEKDICLRARGSASWGDRSFPILHEECMPDDDVVVDTRNGRGRGKK